MHSHAGDRHRNRSRMTMALAINLVLLTAGVIGAVVFGSVALLADAGHVLSDVGAIALGLLGAVVATRPARAKRTFGLHRAEIITALVNGLGLVAVAAFVFVESIGRLSDPPEVEGLGVLLVGVFGLVGNLGATAVLAAGDRSDVNLEGVLRHSAADTLGSLGVIVSAAVVLVSGWQYADPIAGILIGVLVLIGSWRLVREPFEILMETAPPGVDVEQLGHAIASASGVREVHDLHVWSVTSGFPALAAHVRTDPAADPDDVRRRIEALVAERFGIEHTTLQMMAEPLLALEDRRGPGGG
jgi:cobalt-zinc-cadmium efflux system protein